MDDLLPDWSVKFHGGKHHHPLAFLFRADLHIEGLSERLSPDQENTRPLWACLEFIPSGMLGGKPSERRCQIPLDVRQELGSLRTAKPLTQEQLAEGSDVHPRYIQKLESGTAHPSLMVLRKIRHSLHCEWNDLLKGL